MTFDDIYGYQQQKETLYLICDMLRNPDKYKAMGARRIHTLLLDGEPGVGKTLMAQALIDESGWRSIVCRKDKGNKDDFVDAIKKAFAQAKEQAPCIVFLDDMDKFAESERGRRNNAEFVAIQTCLDELGDADVSVVATINDRDLLCDSLVRAGRFGLRLFLSRPNHEQLVQIVPKMLSSVPMAGDVDDETLAYLFHANTCAEVMESIRMACVLAAYDNSPTVGRAHLKAAVQHGERRLANHGSDAATKRRIAYHEAGARHGCVGDGRRGYQRGGGGA